MMADDVKQVKVDNWGIYFLQRLKHFFNRTDYCDLTLQFQDNAQLKVHRLVLSACTEYFELLERTCEMYEDCLVMPDDLQADIVVPIVNFMYTGQLEFRMELLEKLHQCSEIMNMPVLTKLLDSHRPKNKVIQSYSPVKRTLPVKRIDASGEKIQSISATEIVTTTPITYKRSYGKAFDKPTETTTIYRDKKVYLPLNKPSLVSNGARTYREPSPIPLDQRFNKKIILSNPRPTRYELPEELDSDNIFENSFCNISYTSQPLMIHPETRKQYTKRPRLIEASTSKKFGATTVDIVECKKTTRAIEDTLFEDSIAEDSEMFSDQFVSVKAECSRDTNQLFDQILEKNEESSKVTIETKNNKSANLDHAKIISEVLKKYPHLVKSNKNIKLKILNTPTKNIKKPKQTITPNYDKLVKAEKELDYTYETDVLDSKQAARLIAMGAENVEGPWICLICGTPGKAMNFTSYYKFRRHLVDVHHEKAVLNMCEYCGQRSAKRNNLLHHLYTKHGVEPPAPYRFPKCSQCSYVALTDTLLSKHKLSAHIDSKHFRCNVCPSTFTTSNHLLMHIQNTGHKYTADRKSNLQCIYCQKVFMRESNLCAHLKSHHRNNAIKDGIIDDSDEEMQEYKKNIVKCEPSINDFEDIDIQYQIQHRPDGNITVVTKKSEPASNTKQKILNVGLSGQIQTLKNKVSKPSLNTQNEYVQEINMATSNDSHEEIVMIDNNEYIMRDNQLVPRMSKQISEEYILSDHDGLESATPTTSMEFTSISSSNIEENIQHANMLLKNSGNVTESIPIYVSNEEEYKALMASNQSIIFDSSDSNKTLTVLTAPNTSTLETTGIDLNTTQANDMMIIPDDFPLNVSEAVVSENSNIVVVYSHSVNDQNKQYQLLTTQGLGEQFVQSSAILTQNYETVKTTTPIMNTHVLQKPHEQDWQTNLQQIVDTDQIEITPIPQNLQSIVEQDNQVEIISTVDSSSEMSDLPRIEITSNVAVTTSSSMSIMAVNHSQDMATEAVSTTENLNQSTEGEHEDDTQNISSMEIHEGISVEEHTVEEVVDDDKITEAAIENVTEAEEITAQNETVIETEFIAYTQPQTTVSTEAQIYTQPPIESPTYTQPSIESPTYTPPPIESPTFTQPPIESPTFTQPDPDMQPSEIMDDLQHESEEISIDSQSTNIESIQVCNEEEAVSISINVETIINNEAAEKVQTLASEWSEEDTQEDMLNKEDDTSVQKDAQEERLGETVSDDVHKTVNTNQEKELEISDIEESIENIQHEVEKQMTTAKEGNKTAINDVNNSSSEDMGHETVIHKLIPNTVAVIADPAVAKEKITSLLNDWEDNDSQEENDSVSENVSTDLVETEPSETTIEATTQIEMADKQDKIKSLVSDWDEDDEENKD